MISAVGSFNKAIATGNQNVTHGLGVTPKLIILWSASGIGADAFNFLIGFYDGVSNYSVNNTEQGAAATSNADKRIAAKIVSMIDNGGTVIWEGLITAWDSTNFTINWTTNDANAVPINFIAIGGDDIAAKIIQWDYPTSTGNFAITGVGFAPNSYITIHAGLAAAIPNTDIDCAFGIGVAALGNTEKAIGYFADSAEATATDTSRAQQDRILTNLTSDQGQSLNASHVSFDSDGATVNILAGTGTARKMVTLFLGGPAGKCGVFNKPTSTSVPVSQQITGLGIEPKFLMLFSVMSTTNSAVQTHARFVLGATDGVNEVSASYKSEDNVADSDVDVDWINDKSIFIADDDTTNTQAEADISSFDADGFTLSWSKNNAVATEIVYFALGDADFTLDETFDMTEVLTVEDDPIFLLETFDLQETLFETKFDITMEELISNFDADFLVTVIIVLTEDLDFEDSVAERFYFDEEFDLTDAIDLLTISTPEQILTLTETLIVKLHDPLEETFALDEYLLITLPICENFAMQETIDMFISQPLEETFSFSDSIEVSTSGSAGAVSPDEFFEAEDFDEFFEATDPERLV